MKGRTKRLLAGTACAALLSASVVGGTLAYYMDEDSDVNVMTLGNVQIEQIEQEWNDDGKLVDFTQAKPLAPYVGEMGWTYAEDNEAYRQFAMENVVDKYVSVENTGKSDAYVRTIFAFEMGSLTEAEFDKMIGISANAENGAEFPGLHWQWTDDFAAEIDGKNYNIMVAVHDVAVEPGETTIPSLLQVYLSKDATNETAGAIDGNGNGTYDILVLSQAGQVAGHEADGAAAALDKMFGKVADKAAGWFGGDEFKAPVAAATSAELADALAAGESVYLTEDVTVTSTMTIAAGSDAKLNLNGNDLSYAVSNSGASAIINNKGTLEITGQGTISFTAANPDMGEIPSYATNTITNTGTLTIGEGVTVVNDSNGGASYAVDVQSGEFILDGGTLEGERCALRIASFNADTTFVMNDGLVKGATPAWIHLPGSSASDAPSIDVTINGGTFQSTKATSADNDVLYTYSFGNSHANTNIVINGGEFLGGTVSIGSGYKDDAPTLVINGGTFEYDVVQWLEGGKSKVLCEANK